jgi:hypothetical protein
MAIKNVVIGSVTINRKNIHTARTSTHTSWHILQHRLEAMICGGFPTEEETREYCESKGYVVKGVKPHYTVEAST